jgi:hypothetical protein
LLYRKYMAKYTQAKAMTKEINAAYELLVARLEKRESR